METELYWKSTTTKLKLKEFLDLLECVRYYSILFTNGELIQGHVNDIQMAESGQDLYLIKGDKILETPDGIVKIQVCQKDAQYEIYGKNFFGKLYEYHLTKDIS